MDTFILLRADDRGGAIMLFDCKKVFSRRIIKKF